jgi:hypothetical protein
MLSLFLVGGFVAFVTLLGALDEWERAKREGEPGTRRRSAKALIICVAAMTVSAGMIVLTVLKG